MSDVLMQRAALVHWRRKLRTDGIKIRYHAGRIGAVIDALPAGVNFSDEETEGSAQIQSKVTSFLILPTDLVLGGERQEPRAGHWLEIVEGQNLDFEGEEFEVRSGNSGSAWEWSDGHRWFWRVFAIRRSGALNVAGY